MKKYINLGIPIGLPLVLLFVFFSFAKAASPDLPKPPAPDQTGPAWYDPAWNYRRPVVITNNGAQLSVYQVLIKLDNGNFNFNLAKIDGTDIRFTYSDGTTELSYWIEKWDKSNHLAYVWVRVPNVATGNNTIFLYYNNSTAGANSNGNATFDSFEDNWSQYTGIEQQSGGQFQIDQVTEGIYTPFSWTTISGSPGAVSGILTLVDGAGIKSTSSYLHRAVGMRAWFSLGNGYEWGGFINASSGQRTMIGDLPSNPSNLFLIDHRDTITETVLLPRVGGNDWHNNYHIYELRWSASQSKADIDHGLSTATSTQPVQVPNISLPVTLYSYSGSNASLLVDWIYVREYRDPEPTFSVGAEQGLVYLSIDDVDAPDPVRSGRRLTYQLTISNTSEINSPGVVVTDTLPAGVQIGSINTSQGNCISGSVVVCDLNTITANSVAWITIDVTPTVDGEMINVASVGSPGYELDLSDNTCEQETLVDSQRPVVNWEAPVHNAGTYYSSGGLVTLEASAIDNDQVAWVEFKLWDHDPPNNQNPHWIILGRDYTYPYQVQFDTDLLVPYQAYQTFTYAADRAGNQSDPYAPLQRIFLGRRIMTYLPITRK